MFSTIENAINHLSNENTRTYVNIDHKYDDILMKIRNDAIFISKLLENLNVVKKTIKKYLSILENYINVITPDINEFKFMKEKNISEIDEEKAKLLDDVKNKKLEKELLFQNIFAIRNDIFNLESNFYELVLICFDEHERWNILNENLAKNKPKQECLRQSISEQEEEQMRLSKFIMDYEGKISQLKKDIVTKIDEIAKLDQNITKSNSLLRSTKLGLTTDETSFRSTSLRLHQTKTEFQNLKNRRKEISVLCNEQEVLFQKFTAEINQITDSNKELVRDLKKLSTEIDEKKAINDDITLHIDDVNKKIDDSINMLNMYENELKNIVHENMKYDMLSLLRIRQIETLKDAIETKIKKRESEIKALESNRIMNSIVNQEKSMEKKYVKRSKLFPNAK